MSIDVRLTSAGDLPQQAAFVTGAELVVQNVTIRLRTFLGEDPEDIRRGLPWERWNQSKVTDLLRTEMEDLISAEVLDVPGVLEIRELNVDENAAVTANVVVEDDANDAANATLTFTPSDPVGISYRITR